MSCTPTDNAYMAAVDGLERKAKFVIEDDEIPNERKRAMLRALIKLWERLMHAGKLDGIGMQPAMDWLTNNPLPKRSAA